jgi:hypothetical protein
LWYFIKTARYERKALLRWTGYLGMLSTSLQMAQGAWMIANPKSYIVFHSDKDAIASAGGDTHKVYNVDPLSAFVSNLAKGKTSA